MANDKVPLMTNAREDSAHQDGSDDIFNEQIPGLVEDDEEMKNLREHDDDSKTSPDDEDAYSSSGDSSSNPDAAHIYGKAHFLNSVLPARGYTVFAVAALFSLVCYIAIPVVILASSYDVIAQRQHLSETMSLPAKWTQRMLDLDRLDVRLKIFALYVDGMLLPGQNISAGFDNSVLDPATGAITTYSTAALAVVKELDAVFADLDDTIEFVEHTRTNATNYFTPTFVNVQRKTSYNYIKFSMLPEVTRMMQARLDWRRKLQGTMTQLYGTIFTNQWVTFTSAGIFQTTSAVELCNQSAPCVQSGGIDIAVALQSNITNALFRPLLSVTKLIQFLNELNRDVPAERILMQLQALATSLQVRAAVQASSSNFYDDILHQLNRLQMFQNSSRGYLNASASWAEGNLTAMLPPGWASNLYSTVTTGSQRASAAFSELTNLINGEISYLIANNGRRSQSDDIKTIKCVHVFDSIFAHNFEGNGWPSDAVQADIERRHATNAVNSFFRITRQGYEVLLREAHTNIDKAIARYNANEEGAENIDRIQIATSICTVASAALLVYLVVGVSVRLPSSPVSYASLVMWVCISYAVFVTASAAMSMIGVNQINDGFTISAHRVNASVSAVQHAAVYSNIVTTAVNVLSLNMPSLAAPAIRLTEAIHAETSTTSRYGAAFGASYAVTTRTILQNLTETFLDAPSSAMVIRESLSGVSMFSNTSTINLQGVEDESDFDVLPLCNRTRIVGVLTYLVDAFGSLQRIQEVNMIGSSRFASRIAVQPARSAKYLACSLCGLENSIAVDASCATPVPYGLQNHPVRPRAAIQNLFWTTRSGWVLDAWNASTTRMRDSVQRERRAAVAAVQFDASDWKLSRRLLVWLAVFGALLLQGIWYALWKTMFDHTLHMNLLH